MSILGDQCDNLDLYLDKLLSQFSFAYIIRLASFQKSSSPSFSLQNLSATALPFNRPKNTLRCWPCRFPFVPRFPRTECDVLRTTQYFVWFWGMRLCSWLCDWYIMRRRVFYLRLGVRFCACCQFFCNVFVCSSIGSSSMLLSLVDLFRFFLKSITRTTISQPTSSSPTITPTHLLV
jgi:hypothetical protein